MAEVVEAVATAALFVLQSVKDIQNNQMVAVLVLHVARSALQSVRDRLHKLVRIAPMAVMLDVEMIVTIHVRAFAVENVELPAVVNVKGNVDMAVVLSVLD